VSALLKVITPGFFTTVQDSGRRGYLHAGVPVSGALDRDGFMLANALVGNDLNAANLEMIGSGPEFEVMASSVRIALVGGNGTIEVASREEAIRCDRSVRLTKGETVRVRLSSDSFCSYLAVEGGFDIPLCLGSRSTYTRAPGFGGFSGRQLRAGDILEGPNEEAAARTEVMLNATRKPRFDHPIRVVLGPQDDYFTKEAVQQFLSATYKITPASDRIGFRLEGPLLEHAGDYNLVSDGIVTGSIQVPGSKLPIILLSDAQTTGGYPKIATVISADLPIVGIRRAGREVRFQQVSRDEAEQIRRAEHAELMNMIEAIRPLDGLQGLNLEALYGQNLVDGVIDGANY
jgi:allophanate hydrolase